MRQIYYQSAVAGFFTVLFLADLIKRQLPSRRSYTFQALTCALMVTSYFAVAADVAVYTERGLLLQSVVLALLMCAGIVSCFCFHCYILAVAHQLKTESKVIRAQGVLFIMIMLIVFSTPWTKCYFYLAEDGAFQIQPLFKLVTVLLMIQLIYDVLAIWIYCREDSFHRKLFCNILALPFFAGVVSELVHFPNVEYISMMLLFFVYIFYLTLQSPDFFVDNATGAYNRNGFFEVLRERVDYQCETVCLLVRVRNFHSMAQIYGEEVLQLAQQKIRAVLEENCQDGVVYHVGASTFAVMLRQESEAEELYQRIKERILREWQIGTKLVRHEYSYYKISYPQDSREYEELAQGIHYARSDHESRHKPGELVTLCGDTLEESEDRKKVAHLVEEAVMDNSIEIHFQPIYSIEKGKITSLEVLSRLKDENKKYINPEFFIRVAEENHTIIPLGEQIFRKACIFASRNHVFDYGIEDININLSPGQCRYEELTDSFLSIAKQYRIPMEKMHLEITESEFTDAEAVGRTLKRLKETGAKVALDDFGTGYSTLANILELPVDFVKIDKSLVWSFAEGKNQFLNQLMPMIKAEGKKIIAEGIETTEHIDIIKRLQGDFLQGYYYSKPLPEEQFMRFLKDFNGIF